MRIIGGSLRGRSIYPSDLYARPTTDFAKEGLFNVLANEYDFEALHVLDLFGGSGGISFEFASRGCPDVTCVEKNQRNATFIIKSAEQFHLNGAIRVVRHNVFDFLDLCTLTYDVIFADPPYDLQGVDTLPTRIIEKQLLAPNGTFILEHSGALDFSNADRVVKVKRYGNVHFSFFK